MLDAWRETPFYTEKVRAALEWTEAVTMVAETGVPDEVYEAVQNQFSRPEVVELTMAIITINGWNRLAISMGRVVGRYQSHLSRQPAEINGQGSGG